MREVGKAVGALLVDCAITVFTTVVVDTGVKVIEHVLDTWLFDPEEDETQEITLEDLLNAVQGEQKDNQPGEPDEEKCPAECPECTGCVKCKG